MNHFNIFHLDINGEAKERIAIGSKNPQVMKEEFISAYQLNQNVDYEMYYFMPSKMQSNIIRVNIKTKIRK